MELEGRLASPLTVVLKKGSFVPEDHLPGSGVFFCWFFVCLFFTCPNNGSVATSVSSEML